MKDRPIVPRVELPDAFNLGDIRIDPLDSSGPLPQPCLGPVERGSRNIGSPREPLILVYGSSEQVQYP